MSLSRRGFVVWENGLGPTACFSMPFPSGPDRRLCRRWLTMSERDLQRIEVLAEVAAKRRTVVAAAAVLALSVR